MNLWIRLFLYMLRAPWRPRITSSNAVSRLSMRVWPNDLDASFHLNNGRYLTLMDLGRIDFMVSTGLARVILREGWTPIASAIIIRYRRELSLFQRYRLETRILCWAEASAIMEQVFIIESGAYAGQVAARALFKGGIYSRKDNSFIDVARMMHEIGVDEASPPMTEEVEAFMKADAALKIASAQRDTAGGE